jgi:hypothetical protein
MTQSEYAAYYIRFLVTTLGPSVKREAHNDEALQNDLALQADLENKKNGLIVLALVSFIESNFLTKTDLKLLRQFQAPSTVIPPSVNTAHLSSFIYLRDCFAHNPDAVLLGAGTNTSAFSTAVASGAFPWATISGKSITVIPTGIHQLHLNVLRLFGENV